MEPGAEAGPAEPPLVLPPQLQFRLSPNADDALRGVDIRVLALEPAGTLGRQVADRLRELGALVTFTRAPRFSNPTSRIVHKPGQGSAARRVQEAIEGLVTLTIVSTSGTPGPIFVYLTGQ